MQFLEAGPQYGNCIADPFGEGYGRTFCLIADGHGCYAENARRCVEVELVWSDIIHEGSGEE